MHRATSSTSSASSSSLHLKRHRFTREELLKSLELLGPSGNPLPGDLPSPPASRSPSPVVQGTKRRSNGDFEHGQSKKPRRSSVLSAVPAFSQYPSASSNHPPSSTRPPFYPPRPDATEDGELREDPPASSNVVALAILPVRRPRRSPVPDQAFWDEIHDTYHRYGRMLKYSGDARTWSSCSTSSKDYRPLHNPPPLNSPYHRYGSLFARLELVDALVCFVYSMWSKEHSNDTCGRSNWQTQDAFIEWCKHKWNQAVDEREKVFHGFILMLEAFIWGRVYFKSSVELKKRTEQMKLDYDAAQQEQARKQASRLPPASVGSGGTPEMLPSPASIVSGSANSTPTNPNRQTGTPMAAGGPTASNHQPMPPTTAPVPKPQEIPPVTIPVGRSFIKIASDLNNDIARAHACAAKASPLFNISALAKHFPRTYARMVNTTLQADDESEPDIEDEEGELYWPGNFTSGSGVGWICHLGKSMIKEFGKPMGYVGIDGVIPKPRPTKQHDGRSRPPPPADAHHAGITPNAEGSGAVKR